MNALASNQAFADFPSDIQTLATTLEHARLNNYQVPPLTTSIPDLTQDNSYHIAAALRALRCERHGDQVLGRKIGFTNKSIWPEYSVDRSNWSYMYRSSIIDLAHQSSLYVCDLSGLSNLEPKIEPEILLGLKAPVAAEMDDEEVLECVEWIAHGFEIVASVFPGWKFTAADTTAAFALHGMLLLGPKTFIDLSGDSAARLLDRLENFEITLLRNQCVVDTGSGRNVLGSPIKALRHLTELLEVDENNPSLAAGEIVTTGTLTRAISIQSGERWSTHIEGLDVSPMDVTFEMKK